MYICPLPIEPPFHLPPHPTPSRLSQNVGFELPHPTTHFHWPSMAMCVFQCYSLNPSHPLLPLCVHKFVWTNFWTCLHLHCCPAHKFTSTIFLGSISSVQFSRSIRSDSLRPHELQHARPPCPSPTPGVHSNSCPSSP